ncbi:1005_t:CDS:2 [Ambispora leptoticha]|uniref:Protein YIP n=1 Tax=Ambispora leptoticha TaxID=144679 RepID=A0A9N9FG36_9GLOM|nr:1005_t:CDS:2 [Ambispora leptoticha]
MSKDYDVVVEVEDDPGVERHTLEFQDFTSGSGVGGKITADKQASSNHGGFNDPFYDPSQSRPDAQSGQAPIWSVEYYAQFFDVDTFQVLERASKSLFPKDNFIEVVGNNPDLYGPFWIATTVVFLLFVTSTIAASIEALINGQKITYDIPILSFGAMTIYTYTFLLPLLIWVGLKYLGCKPSLLDIIGLYGYGLTIWLPISVICIIPSDVLRWTLVIVGFSVSGFFITRNLYPVIARADSKTARIIIIIIVVLHAALSFLLKREFFSLSMN